jgi:hypothetical protein
MMQRAKSPWCSHMNQRDQRDGWSGHQPALSGRPIIMPSGGLVAQAAGESSAAEPSALVPSSDHELDNRNGSGSP